jgi:hypothetical protein
MEQVAQQGGQRQAAPQREQSERMSWARAMIFAVGFFFIAAILIGQLPSYIYTQMTASTLVGLEQTSLASRCCAWVGSL